MDLEKFATDVSHYYDNNGMFTADEYRKYSDDKGQTQSFSGVGAQHQSSQSERAIQTIIYMAWTFMVHTSLHWTERGYYALSLWSFLVKMLV